MNEMDEIKDSEEENVVEVEDIELGMLDDLPRGGPILMQQTSAPIPMSPGFLDDEEEEKAIF